MALNAIPTWLLTVITEKLIEAGIATAQNQLRELPPSEDQLREYVSHTESRLETIPYKIPCKARSAGLRLETFFLWPKLETRRTKRPDGKQDEPKEEVLSKPIPAQNLLFSPPAGKNLFAIEGPAGAGKTTLARSLVYWTAKAKLARPFLPIYLDARDLAKIADDRGESGLGWQQIPENWALLLAVDGLDELEPSLKNRALERLKGPWLEEADKHLIFLFGRPGSVRSLPWESREERVLALELRPWTLEEVKRYLENWVREGGKQVQQDPLQKGEAERILQHVKENFGPDVLPLHIYLLVCDYLETRDIENLPRTRLELYERYLVYATLYEAESSARRPEGTARPLSKEEIFALGCLELAIKESPKLESRIQQPRANCSATLLSGLRRKWEIYCNGRVSSGIPWEELIKLWQDRGLCWLGHKSFHDFLAAKALAKIYEGRPEDFWQEWVHPKVFDPYWSQTLVFSTVLLPDPDRERILSGLLAVGDCDSISKETGRHHAVIAEIIAESEGAEESLLRAWLSQSPAPEHIARVHRAAPEWSLSALEALAKDPDPWVRLEAAKALAQLGEKALPALEALAKDPDPWVRLGAAKALAQLGYREKALPALEALAKDPNPRVRLGAAEALAQLGEKALPALEALAKDPDPLVRRGAAKALAQLGHPPLCLKELPENQTPGAGPEPKERQG